MKRQNFSILFGMFVALLLLQISSATAQTLVRLDKVSSRGFASTVAQAETAIKKRGMMIVATLDHQNMLRMVGASIRGSKTLEFGKPDMMKSFLPDNPHVGLEMPIKLYIYERADGKVVISYYKPSGGFASYGKEPLTMAGQMMDGMLEEIASEAGK